MPIEELKQPLTAAKELIKTDAGPYMSYWFAVISLSEAGSNPVSGLVQAIAAQNELSSFHDSFQYGPVGGLRVSPHHLAAWLLRRATRAGVETALEGVAQYLEGRESTFEWVLAIDGVQVASAVDLYPGVRVLPWDDVPDCEPKETLQSWSMWLQMSGVFPTAAVALRDTWRPYHTNDAESDEGRALVERGSGKIGLLHDCLTCISLFGPSGPRAVAQICAFPESIPMVAPALMLSIPDRGSSRVPWSSEWSRPAADLIEAFRRLSTEDRQHYGLVAGRLISAVRTGNLADKAIDLGVALEGAFLRDQPGDRIELSYRMRLRAAWFLGSGVEERANIMRKLRDVYAARSTALHAGTLKPQFHKLDTAQLLEDGEALTAQAVRKLVQEGEPDWERLCLGAT